MKFLIRYGNGSSETVNTEQTTDDAFIAEKWGMPDVFQAFLDGGGMLSLLVEPEPEPEPGSPDVSRDPA
jgi:hypothetical protein